MRDPPRPSLPRLPEHLRRPRQHRRARRAGAAARPRARRRGDRAGRRRAPRRDRPLLHRRRPGPRAGARRATTSRRRRTRCDGRRGRRGRAGGLRRLPAARALLPRRRRQSSCPGIGLLPLQTVAGHERHDRRRAARLRVGRARRSPGSRTTPAGRSSTTGAEPLGRVLAASATTARRASRAAATGASYGTYLHGPLLPRNPWFADRRARRGARARDRDGRAASRRSEPLAGRARASQRTPSRPRERAARAADRSSNAPRGAEVHGRVARLPACEEPLDRRVHDDVLQLLVREQPRALDRRVPRLDVVQRAVRQVGREDDVDDVACAHAASLRRDRVDERDRPFELDVGRRSPSSSRSSRRSASISVSPTSTPPPGSSQYSLPGFSWRQSRTPALPA